MADFSFTFARVKEVVVAVRGAAIQWIMPIMQSLYPVLSSKETRQTLNFLKLLKFQLWSD